MESGGMSSRIITKFSFEFWDIQGHLGRYGWPGGVMARGALKLQVWGLEGLAPIFPYVKVGFPPASGCELDGLLWE